MEWIWKEIDKSRYQRSKELKPLSLDTQNLSATFKGSKGSYVCTLSHCSCQDFQLHLKGKMPCKHILHLGAVLGAYDSAAYDRMLAGDEVKEKLALAYGLYYLFNDPVMSDQEYDQMKAEWADLLPTQGKEKGKLSSDKVDYTKEELSALLKERNIQYADKMEAGGCFWIERNEQSEALLEGKTMCGRKCEAANNSKALGNKPAYYFRER